MNRGDGGGVCEREMEDINCSFYNMLLTRVAIKIGN
jgi:hypothetical protein